MMERNEMKYGGISSMQGPTSMLWAFLVLAVFVPSAKSLRSGLDLRRS